MRIEVLTAVLLMSWIFWDVICCSVSGSLRSKGMYLQWPSSQEENWFYLSQIQSMLKFIFAVKLVAAALLSWTAEHHNLNTDILLCLLKVNVFICITDYTVPTYYSWRWRHSVVQNSKNWSPSYTMSYPRRMEASTIMLWKPQNLKTIHK